MVADRILSVESGGNATARNPRSTAYGAGQFIESTWLDILSKTRPDLTAGKTREQILSLRSDPDLSRAMTEAYAAQNSGALSEAGLPVTPGTTYLAHFAGPKGAVGVLNADPSAPVGAVLGPAVVKANPFLANMTVADLRAWADRKMGAKPANPGSAPQMPAQPMQAQSMPGYASAPNTAPAGMAGAQPSQSGGSFGSLAPMPQMDMPPIMAPPRRPFDIDRLRAAIQQTRHGRVFS